MSVSVVVVNNQFNIRQFLKYFSASLNQSETLYIYTSDNTVEGLGLIYVTEPDLIILDYELPYYSNRNILEFLKTNNKILSKSNIVVLYSETKPQDLPENIVLTKKGKECLDEIIKISEWSGKAKIGGLIKTTADLAFRNDKRGLKGKLESVIRKISLSLLMLILRIKYGPMSEKNIQQKVKDDKNFRKEYYPSIVYLVTTFIVTFVVLSLALSSQILLYSGSQITSSASETYSLIISNYDGNVEIEKNGDGHTLEFTLSSAPAEDVYIKLHSQSSNLQPNTSLSEANASYLGESANHQSGSVVRIVGDVNNDGFDDIMIAAHSYSSSRGKIYLIFGKASGWSNNISLSDSDASFIGEADGDGFSSISVKSGDVNGDGIVDILLGAPGNDQIGSDAGKSYLIFGKETGWANNVNISEAADVIFLPEAAGDNLGNSISFAGDINNDGIDDLLLGSYRAASNWGKAYVVFGKESGWDSEISVANADASYIAEAAGDILATTVTGLGDVNGDGIDDFAIGSEGNDAGGNGAGKNYLVFGKESGWSTNINISNSDASFLGIGASYYSGYMRYAGDINGDGLSDFFIGAYGANNWLGTIHLLYGSTTELSNDVILSNYGYNFIHHSYLAWSGGNDFSAFKDINNDGMDEMIFSDQWESTVASSAGITYLVLGREDHYNNMKLNIKHSSFLGEAASDFAGVSDSGGDVNGDGFVDLVIGARGNDQSANNAGKSYLILSDPGKTYISPDWIKFTTSNWNVPQTIQLNADKRNLNSQDSDLVDIYVSSTDTNYNDIEIDPLNITINKIGGPDPTLTPTFSPTLTPTSEESTNPTQIPGTSPTVPISPVHTVTGENRLTPTVTQLPVDNINQPYVDKESSYVRIGDRNFSYDNLIPITPGDEFIIYGKTLPFAEIEVVFKTLGTSVLTHAIENGTWEVQVSTIDFLPGIHTFMIIITFEGLPEKYESEEYVFEVLGSELIFGEEIDEETTGISWGFFKWAIIPVVLVAIVILLILMRRKLTTKNF